MTQDLFLENLLQSISQHANVMVQPAQYDEKLNNLGVDSIYAIDVANDMEDMLDIIIDDRDILQFDSVNNIMNYFLDKKAQSA